MLKHEFYQTREDGVKLYRTYSDQELMIRKNSTDEVYTEAVDVENSGFNYTETDIPIPEEEELTVGDALLMLKELGVDTDDIEG